MYVAISFIIVLSFSYILSKNNSVELTVEQNKKQQKTKIYHIKKKHIVPAAKVRPKEQKKIINLFQQDKKKQEAWALFSYGGYVDQGQIVIYKEANIYSVYYAKPQVTSGKSIDGTFDYVKINNKITADMIKTLEEIANLANNLKELKYPIFDAIRYEYIHLKKTPRETNLIKRLYMDFPDASSHKKKLDYMNIITFFQTLIGK